MVELRDYQRDLLQKTQKALISPRERRSRAQRLPSGLFLCADFSASNSIKMAVKLLERCGEDPSQFSVQLS